MACLPQGTQRAYHLARQRVDPAWFKGLESSVVVLCELEDLDEESRDHQLYVALSRARNHCVVVAPKAA